MYTKNLSPISKYDITESSRITTVYSFPIGADGPFARHCTKVIQC